jgi:hypothetical protein
MNRYDSIVAGLAVGIFASLSNTVVSAVKLEEHSQRFNGRLERELRKGGKSGSCISLIEPPAPLEPLSVGADSSGKGKGKKSSCSAGSFLSGGIGRGSGNKSGKSGKGNKSRTEAEKATDTVSVWYYH